MFFSSSYILRLQSGGVVNSVFVCLPACLPAFLLASKIHTMDRKMYLSHVTTVKLSKIDRKKAATTEGGPTEKEKIHILRIRRVLVHVQRSQVSGARMRTLCSQS